MKSILKVISVLAFAPFILAGMLWTFVVGAFLAGVTLAVGITESLDK